MDNKEKYTYRDSSNVKHEILLNKGDFELAVKDESIHDVKFKTKPTTFLKDAFKRFCKNKSSVAGAIILGLLLVCSFLIPLIDQSDIDTNHPQERMLEPKLFNAGTGFWDGTKRITNVVCDTSISTEDQAGNVYYYPSSESYVTSAVTNLSLPRENNEVNTASEFVTGGFVRITNTNQLLTEEGDDTAIENNTITYSSTPYSFSKDGTYGLNIEFGDEEIQDLELGDYRIYLSYSITTNGQSGQSYTPTFNEFTPLEVEDGTEVAPYVGTWNGSVSINNQALNIELVLEESNVGTFNGQDFSYTVTEPTEESSLYTINIEADDGTFEFNLTFDGNEEVTPENGKLSGTYRSIVVNQYNLTGTSEEPFINTYESFSNNDILSGIRETLSEENEISDLTINIDVRPGVNVNTYLLVKSINLTTSIASEQNIISQIGYSDANASLLVTSGAGYWRCNGQKNLYHGTAYVCDFTYDTYEAVYGNSIEIVPQTTFNQYIERGWINEIDWDEAVRAGSNQERLAEIFNAAKTDLTDDYCPVMSLVRVRRGSAGGVTYYTIEAQVSRYKLLGYTSMPRFLLGTDSYGKDMLKVVFVGLRNSLLLGLCVTVVCFIFGLCWGAICGYYGGNIDLILERFTDFLSGVPWIVIMTLCVLNLGSNFGVFLLAMCMTGWIGTAARTRTQFYRFRDREYTLASRTLGASSPRLIFKHILPNAMGTIVTSSILMIPSVIFSEATISYLGLGFRDMTSLGVTLSDNQQYLSTYPYLIIFPSAIMALIMISFNLFGNGLRDALNPSLKGSD